MLLFHGPLYRFDNERQRHARRHEPFTPHLPEQVLRHPSVLGAILTAIGVFGIWYVSTRLPHWPDWTLFPSLILSVLAMVSMIMGLGILVVRGMEPLLGRMDWEWDGEPLASLGIPVALQRKCESIGYWTADDVARAVNANRFPWTSLDYDERLQIERAAQRWSVVMAARADKRTGASAARAHDQHEQADSGSAAAARTTASARRSRLRAPFNMRAPRRKRGR